MRELLYKQLQNLENRGALYFICLMIMYSLTEGGVERVKKNSCKICRGALYLICLMIINSLTEGGVEQVIKKQLRNLQRGAVLKACVSGWRGLR